MAKILTFKLKLGEEAERLLNAVADNNIPAYFTKMVGREVDRLWHIERSKPKGKEPRPIGRPPLSEQAKRAKEITSQLSGILGRLKTFYGAEYPARLRTLEEAVATASAQEDVVALSAILNEQAWTKRG